LGCSLLIIAANQFSKESTMLKTLQGGRYKIISALGGGGFGQVYIAEDNYRPGNPRCIVKHLQPASRDLSFLQIARRLFNSEAEILEKLGHHEQIPQLLAYFEENQEFYLVQELIEGVSLNDELSGGTKLDEIQVIAILKDVLDILKFVHSYQAIHRDIKPSNLIRRQHDGKLVLIDFGAVKEIRTQFANNLDAENSEISVAIGTQGYMSNEQSAGKPRLNSDIYALGIVAIQALTGLRPSKLKEDLNTSEIIWRNHANVSNSLANIIDRMVRYDFRVRYQSATEVLEDLAELINPSSISTKISRRISQKINWKQSIRNATAIIGTSWLLTTGLVLGVRELKLLQPLELAAYDRMMRLRFTTRFYQNLSYEQQAVEDTDSRLLIVGITDEDVQQYSQILPDSVINQLLIKLQSYQPSLIGLNIDLPEQKNFAEGTKKKDNIIGACKFTSLNNPEIPPPANLNPDNIGFNDIVIDEDRIIRRSLLFASREDKKCTAEYSFAALLAIAYLEKQNISVTFSKQGGFQIGNVRSKPLKSNSGGYQKLDDTGFQIMLDYRYPGKIAEQVSLADILANRVNPNLIKNRIVIIGTAKKSDETLLTPYSQRRRISPLAIHAQVVSQILTAATSKMPLPRAWSRSELILWIAAWALTGGILAWLLRSWLTLLIGKAIILLALILVTFSLFMQSAWVPWVPLVEPALALIITGWLVAALRVYTKKYLPTHLPRLTQIKNRILPSAIANQPLDSQIQTILPSSLILGKTRVNGKIQSDQMTRYSLTCKQGQQLTLHILAGDINITVIDPDGKTVATNIDEPRQWQGFLPVSGDYTVQVLAAKQSEYAVDINVEIELSTL
jgi:CHASE2 domain-containing sensor protein/predicted Ser/Thr protein kinase